MSIKYVCESMFTSKMELIGIKQILNCQWSETWGVLSPILFSIYMDKLIKN